MAAVPASAPAPSKSPPPSPPQQQQAPEPGAAVEGAPEFARQLADCRAAFARNRLRDAAAACGAAVASNPGSADALTMLARTELNRGRLARAGEMATKAVAIDPRQADAYVIIGGVRQEAGQNREAKAAYRRYLQLAPQGRYADELRSIINSL
jgi:tetratricopeptide (TPR) repeat protein